MIDPEAMVPTGTGVHADAPPGLRISVWRPFLPSRPLAMTTTDADYVTFLSIDDELHEEIFTWQTREDIWGGVSDADIRRRLSDRMMSELEPVRPLSDRG